MHPFFKGFLPGLFVGAAIGLLLSPHKGQENREFVRLRIREAVEAGRRAAQEQDEHLRTRFRQTIGTIVEKEPPRS